MAKYVRYNGDTISYKGCDSPLILEKGKVYEVQFEEDLGWQTNYKLKGLNGNFNSVWFNEVEIPVVMALSNEQPKLKESMKDILCFIKNDKLYIKTQKTTPVQSIEKIEENIFKVFTQNTIYIVQVTD